MNTKDGYSTGKGLIARPEFLRLTYAYPVTITALSWRASLPPTTFSLRQLVDAAMQSVNQPCHGGLSVKLLTFSPVLITRSIFDARHFQASLLTNVHITASEQFLSFVRIRGRQSMLVLARAIDLQGCIAIIRRTHVLTYCAWNLYSGAPWQEPPPFSIARRKAMQSFALNWEILGDGDMPSGKPTLDQTNELRLPPSHATTKTP